MKSLMKKIIAPLVILLLIFAIQACSDAEGSESNVKEDKIRSVSVQVKELKSENYTNYISLIGVVKAVQRTSLSPSEAASIKSIEKEKGSRVKKDDTLIIMDNDVLKASLDAAEAQYKLDEITFQKQEIIYKENINSEYELLQSKYRRDQSKANYELMKARFDKTFLKAPFDGVIDRRDYEVGEFVAPGVTIVELVNKDSYKVEAGVPERFVGQIKEGYKAVVKLKSVDADELSGIVTYVGTSINTDNRTFPIEVEINGKGEFIKPELAAEIFVENGVYDNVFLIPDDVIMRLDENYVVFVENNGIAESKNIDIINRSGENVAVRSGLQEGENLVVVGHQNLIDGQRIKIVN